MLDAPIRAEHEVRTPTSLLRDNELLECARRYGIEVPEELRRELAGEPPLPVTAPALVPALPLHLPVSPLGAEQGRGPEAEGEARRCGRVVLALRLTRW